MKSKREGLESERSARVDGGGVAIESNEEAWGPVDQSARGAIYVDDSVCFGERLATSPADLLGRPGCPGLTGRRVTAGAMLG
jgi:hypothetical protein